MSTVSKDQGSTTEASGTTTTITNVKVEVGRHYNGLRCRLSSYSEGKNSIWVIVDRLTKSTHFMSIKNTYSMDQMAGVYVKEIVRLHGPPVSITSDLDPRFVSRFWQSLQKAMGTKLNLSTAFHQ